MKPSTVMFGVAVFGALMAVGAFVAGMILYASLADALVTMGILGTTLSVAAALIATDMRRYSE